MTGLSSSPTPLAWARAFKTRGPGPFPGTHSAFYRMTDLIGQGMLAPGEARRTLQDSGLMDMVWEVTWADDAVTPDGDLPRRLSDCDGYALFIHGWTGNHLIWEEVPALLVQANPNLIAITIDHNGFGQSRFVVETPDLEACCPPSAMATVERLVHLLRIRRQPGETRRKVINYVGHSMGGAALFYLDPTRYDIGEETRYAVAPALLLNANTHRLFYNALGLGIGIVDKLRIFEPIEDLIQPVMIDAVCEGGSEFLKQTHLREYDETPRGTTSATFRAMGMLRDWEIAPQWQTFGVMLGHRDSLVGLTEMVDLLTELKVPQASARVVSGSHYMFSVGPEAPQHAENRDLLVRDVLALHERALDMQRTGKGSRGFG